MKHLLGVALVICVVSGCGLVTIESSSNASRSPGATAPAKGKRQGEEPKLASAQVPAAPAAPAEPAAPVEPALSCPSDLTITAPPRTIMVDAVYATPVSDAQYAGFHWAPGHRKAPAPSFFLSNEQAIAAVLATETKFPGLVPAGFRDELAKAPKDAELRLRMARCEVREAATHRRGAHDAAMAVLLGASPVAAGRAIAVDFHFDSPHTVSCEGAPCPGKTTCLRSARVCLDDAFRTETMVSEPELVIEDALSRALMKDFFRKGAEWPAGYSLRMKVTDALLAPPTPHELSRVALVMWGRAHVVKCGNAICNFDGSQTAHGEALPIEMRDLRDHGTAGPTQGIVGVDENKCWKATGFPYSDDCVGNCREQGLEHDPACTTKCYMPYCKKRPASY